MKIIKLHQFLDERGSLCVIEKECEFQIRRIYYIFDANSVRGGHSHKVTKQALLSVSGNCIVDVLFDNKWRSIKLDSPNKMLILEPEEIHFMRNFSTDCVLLVLASQPYDKNDYIDYIGEYKYL